MNSLATSCLMSGMMAIALSGCAAHKPQPSASYLASAREQLSANIRACTQQYGYDPATVSGIPENALAPNELQWRQCVYMAATTYTHANPAMRPRYEALIAKDKAMTEAIQEGAMTRSQRKLRIQELLADIRAAEDEQIKATEAQQQRQRQEMENTISAIRALGR